MDILLLQAEQLTTWFLGLSHVGKFVLTVTALAVPCLILVLYRAGVSLSIYTWRATKRRVEQAQASLKNGLRAKRVDPSMDNLEYEEVPRTTLRERLDEIRRNEQEAPPPRRAAASATYR